MLTKFINLFDKKQESWKDAFMTGISDKKLITALGGQSQLARLIGVHRCTVYQWTKRGIPRPWRLYFEKSYPKLFTEKT